MNKKCNVYQNKMDLYVEKQLSEKEMLEWESHIAECLECKKELSLYNMLFSSLSSFPQKDLPYGFSEKLHYLLQDAEKEKSKKRGLIFQLFPYYKYGLAAAILLFIIGVSSVNINLYDNKIKNEEQKVKNFTTVDSPQSEIRNIVITPQKKAIFQNRNVISKKVKIQKINQKLLPSYTEITAKELFLDEKVLKIDIASDEYLRNIKLKIELSDNISFAGEDNKVFSNNITKDNLDITPTPWTLLLPVLYKNREDGNLTLTFFDEEGEFAKYKYELSYQEPKKIHCLVEGKEKEVILGWIKDGSPLREKILKDTKNVLQVSAGSGEICFAPFSIENAELIPNIDGKVEMIFADGISQDITDMQIMIF